MNRQRHVILRQTIELAVDRQELAWPLQQRVGEIMRGAHTLIESCCDELSSADSLYRIESLEIDLGNLDFNRLEQDMLDKLSEALRRGLAEHIRDQETSPIPVRTVSRLELISHFARTGTLPWWADASLSEQLAENFDCLLSDAPVLLARQIAELLNETPALRRIVSHFSDRRLTALIMLKAPNLGDFPLQLCQALLKLPRYLPVRMATPSSRFRAQIWEWMLLQTFIHTQASNDPVSFSRAVLINLAAQHQLTYSVLAAAFKQLAITTDNLASIVQWVANLLADELTHDQAAVEAVARQADHPSVSHADQTLDKQVFIALQQWLEPHGACPAWLTSWPKPLQDALFKQLSALGDQLPSSLEQMWLWMHAAESEPAPLWLQSWPQMLREELIAQLDPQAKHTPALEQANPWAAKQMVDSDVAASWDMPLYQQSSFSDADLIYLENAGLVILWPFLKTFFERIGLLEQGDFSDDCARQRGIALMHYLTTANSDIQEYQLPLNKVLCGVPPDWLFEADMDLSEEDRAECQQLLAAVIDSAPILNHISIAGFQGSFLIRAGVLEVRDGNWLLRVERETHDLVLDRFPWSFSWVKLPWMPTALQVEW